MIDRFAHERDLGVEFVRFQPSISVAANAAARRAQTDERRHVERNSAAFDERKEIVEIAPRKFESDGARTFCFAPFGEAAQRCGGRAAVAPDFRRDALADFTFAAAVDEPEFVGMRVYVDEARCEDAISTVDALVRVAIAKVLQ